MRFFVHIIKSGGIDVKQLGRFFGVGIAATLTHVCIALFIEKFLHASGQTSNLAGFLVGMFVSYFGHAYYTFSAKSNHFQQVIKFSISAFSGLGMSSLITLIVFTKMQQPFVIAMLFVALIVPPFTFIISKLWVFREKKI